MDPIFKKNIQALNSSKKETSTPKAIGQDQLLYSLCDRNQLIDEGTNYFLSFGIPHLASRLKKTDNLSMIRPELYQLNVDKIVIIPIDSYYYSEYIDGSNLSLFVPQTGDSTNSTIKLVSTTYTTVSSKQSSPLLGDNVAFLFSDAINKPYTGTTHDKKTNNSAHTTWNTSNKFPATSYQDLEDNDIDTDSRSWASVRQSFGSSSTMNLLEAYPKRATTGYNFDIPVGFVSLDKGYIVITHQDIVNAIPWNSGYTVTISGDSSINAPQTITPVAVNSAASTKNILFPSILTQYNNSENSTSNVLQFNSVKTEFKTSIVCLALPGEFYLSQNPSWNLSKNLTEKSNGTNNFDDVYITEAGFYNMNGDLIAVAKFSQPIKKSYNNVLSFSLEIDV